MKHTSRVQTYSVIFTCKLYHVLFRVILTFAVIFTGTADQAVLCGDSPDVGRGLRADISLGRMAVILPPKANVD